LQAVLQETSKNVTNDSKTSQSSEIKSGGTAVADLVDLELELSSLQQGLNQMERITPSDPFGSKDDPFGDSFTSYTVKSSSLAKSCFTTIQSILETDFATSTTFRKRQVKQNLRK
jgi:hypothetical protein